MLRLLADRSSFGLLLVVPAVQLILFGYAVNPNPRNIPIAISPSCSELEPLLTQAVAAAGSFQPPLSDPLMREATQYIHTGRALIALGCSTHGKVEVFADASDPSAVRPAVAVLENTVLRKLLSMSEAEAQPTPEVRWVYNPEARVAWSLAPGLIGVIVMITTLLLGAVTLVREREQGSWEGLLSTPVRPVDALLGKLAPYVVVAFCQTSVVVALANLLFDVPTRGSLAALLAASAVSSIAYLALGFFISARARNQTQAIQTAVFFYLPSMLLSGFMFPFEGMPRWAQHLGNALPLTHFVRVARGVLLKGYGASQVAQEMLPVVAFALCATLLAVASFPRQLQ